MAALLEAIMSKYSLQQSATFTVENFNKMSELKSPLAEWPNSNVKY